MEAIYVKVFVIFLIMASKNNCSSKMFKSDVLIVGSGASGIAAASKLTAAGFNVFILEAENRIGGRIFSTPFGESIVDLGGEWCHGEEGNIIHEIMKPFQVLKHSNYKRKFYFSNRYDISDDFNNQLFDVFDNIFDGDGDTHQDSEISMGHYFMKAYNETAYKIWSNDAEKLNIAFMAMDYFNKKILDEEGCFNWFDEPAMTDYENCEGDSEMNWNGYGFKTILDIMIGDYLTHNRLQQNILLNKIVREITYTENEAFATCQDGTIYTAPYLISTISLGVLKHEHASMFRPRLSNEKKHAIESIGYDAVHKVMVYYPEIWWDTRNFSGFEFVWDYQDRELLPIEYPYGPLLGNRHWLRDIMKIYRLERNPNVLSFWFTGEMVPHIENIPDEMIMKGLNFVLEKFLGHKYHITKPDQILREKWYSHPHFRGAYSYQTFASRKGDRSSNEILGEPLVNSKGEPKVLFAGEATHPTYFGTVHGAIESGFREAERILKWHKHL